MASNPEHYQIRVPILLWRHVILELRSRGAGKGESGAFLLGREDDPRHKVRDFVCYDDLDQNAYQRGAINFHASGYAVLWEYCRERRLEVLADVHTHPGRSVSQSLIDKRNPMLPQIGHTAIIIPHYAQTPWWTLQTAGTYEYLGSFEWRTHPVVSPTSRVVLRPW